MLRFYEFKHLIKKPCLYKGALGILSSIVGITLKILDSYTIVLYITALMSSRHNFTAKPNSFNSRMF